MIYDKMIDLATCLCATLIDEGLPEPCFCGVVPGEASAQQYMGTCTNKNGMAWVRLMNAYPAQTVGQQDTGSDNCSATFGFDIEMGVIRAVQLGDQIGNPPTPAELLAATQLQLQDMEAMRKTLLCCNELFVKDWMLGQYTPLGPAGNMVGGWWNVNGIDLA